VTVIKSQNYFYFINYWLDNLDSGV